MSELVNEKGEHVITFRGEYRGLKPTTTATARLRAELWHLESLGTKRVDEALAEERRATVERIAQAYLASQVPDASEEFYRGIDAASANLRAILDEEAQR